MKLLSVRLKFPKFHSCMTVVSYNRKCNFLCQENEESAVNTSVEEAAPAKEEEKKEEHEGEDEVSSIQAYAVLRIRDVCPGSDFFPFRIPDPNLFHPESSSKNISILTQKMISKLKEI
jgi:hypothetical protein